jgi:hypothetical protein
VPVNPSEQGSDGLWQDLWLQPLGARLSFLTLRHRNFASWGSFSMADKSYMLKSQFSCQIEYLRSTAEESNLRPTD